jgi:excisionase family DNA binding protein
MSADAKPAAPTRIEPPRMWSARDVAAFLGVSKSWVYMQSEAKKIPHRKLGGLIRFDPDEIKRWWNGEQLDHPGRLTVVTPLRAK